MTVQRPTLRKPIMRNQYLWLNIIIQRYCTYCMLWLDMHLTLHKISHIPYPLMAANTVVSHSERLTNTSKVFCMTKIHTHSPTSEIYNFIRAWCNKHLSWSCDSNNKIKHESTMFLSLKWNLNTCPYKKTQSPAFVPVSYILSLKW